MYAVEFEASINDGVVKIPSTFHKLYSSTKAKIIIMIEDDVEVTPSQQSDFIEMLANNPRHLDESIAFLSREQANER
jgi:hypothetical protein